MKITLYTVNDCEFSKQEKEYLNLHQLQFEEKNLELNKEFLTEMLVISDNFAGTPVTKIEKDDGQVVVLKGFTKEEFDEALGFKVEPVAEQKDVALPTIVNEVVPPVSTPVNTQPDLNAPPAIPTSVGPVNNIAVTTTPPTPPPEVEPPTQLTQDPNTPVAATPTVQEPVSTAPPAAPTPVVEPPVVETPKPPEDPKLASVLSSLQNMSSEPASPVTNSSTPTPTQSSGMPSIPDPNFG